MESYTDQSAYGLDNQNSVQQGLPSSDVSPLQGKVKPSKIWSSLALSYNHDGRHRHDHHHPNHPHHPHHHHRRPAF